VKEKHCLLAEKYYWKCWITYIRVHLNQYLLCAFLNLRNIPHRRLVLEQEIKVKILLEAVQRISMWTICTSNVSQVVKADGWERDKFGHQRQQTNQSQLSLATISYLWCLNPNNLPLQVLADSLRYKLEVQWVISEMH
jgi:hypothetical protein